MTLSKYIPDRTDRKKMLKALEGTYNTHTHTPDTPLHLPVGEWLKLVLSLPEETAYMYADALRSINIHTGQQLVSNVTYEEVESQLSGVGVLQGHKKAIKILMRNYAAAAAAAEKKA
jgi:hypothetical protein